MNFEELQVRNYLKTLSHVTIVDSVYLFGMDFDSESIYEIFKSIYALEKEVESLQSIINRNFESVNGEMLPKSRESQAIISQGCFRKSTALDNILKNKTLKDLYEKYKIMFKVEEEKSKDSR